MALKKFRVIKPEIRVLGVDDGVFIPHKEELVSVVGVVFRGGYWLDGVMHTKIKVDGLDATDKISSMISSSPHHKQLRVVMLNGVTFAGFNVVDIRELNARIRLPVMAVMHQKPNMAKIRAALKNLPRSEERWKAFENAGEIFEVSARSKGAKVYMQIAGIFEDDAYRILQLMSTRSNIPEALRVAHLIASGIGTI